MMTGRVFTAPRCLMVPATLTQDDWIARMQIVSKDSVEPGTEVNIEAEEFLKAARGEPSPLGEALPFDRKYGARS